MPRTTRTFTYTLIPPPDQVEAFDARVRKILGWACDGDSRITCHSVTGAALGTVSMSMTIKARDRWWVTQLAQDVLNHVLWGLETNATRLDLQSRRQEPHTHRGYQYGRTKTYRERASSTPGSTTCDNDPLGDDIGTTAEASS